MCSGCNDPYCSDGANCRMRMARFLAELNRQEATTGDE
jgi:hypothetical protein